MKNLLAITLCILGASCAPKIIPTAKIVPEVARFEAIAPRAVKVDEKISVAQTTASDLRTGITRALDEADRLRLQKSATEAELTNMWSILTKEKENTVRLFNQLGETKKESARLASDSALKDAEVTQLRQANDTLRNQVGNAMVNEKINAEQIEKLSKKAAVYDFFKTWIIWICVVLFVLAIVWVAIRFRPTLI